MRWLVTGKAHVALEERLESQIATLRHDLHIQTMRAGGPESPPPEYDEVRIGFKVLDPLASQSELRGEIEPTIKIEVYPDKWVFKCQRQLEEPEYNQLVSILGFKLDRS